VRSEQAAAGRIARWLLLACTIIGLAAMHSLGHGSSHTGAGHDKQPSTAAHGERLSAVPAFAAAMSGSMTALTVVLTAAPAAMTSGVCSGDCHLAGGPSRHRDDLPGFSVCLAVLASFGIAVLLAWLRLSTPAPAWARARTPVLWVASRAPPRAGARRRVAALSVMRR
jgi:hypothetical protein